jgi:hypothetical protein
MGFAAKVTAVLATELMALGSCQCQHEDGYLFRTWCSRAAMLDDFLRDLNRLQQRLQRLEGSHSIPFSEMFPDEFMLLNTEFQSIVDMIEMSGFRVETADDFKAIPDDEWDAFVRSRTRFTSWEEMRATAGNEWMSRQLGDG